MLIIDALFWPFLSRQLDKNADEFIEETDWEQVQLQVSAETMGSFRRKRFTPYLGWWALSLFDVCHGWSVAYLKCFFFLFLGCTAMCDGLSNMYHAAYIQGTLQKEEPISSHCSAVVFTCVPCHVPGCIWRILTRQKTSVSRVPITLLQETSVADENSFCSCTTVTILFSRLITIVENVNPFVRTARSCCLLSGQGTMLVISFSLSSGWTKKSSHSPRVLNC